MLRIGPVHPDTIPPARRDPTREETLIILYWSGGYQALFPRSYRLVITIILQDHPGSSTAL